MIRWNLFFEVEKVEQLALIDRLATHHDRPPSLNASGKRNHDSSISTRPFSTGSTQSRHEALASGRKAHNMMLKDFCRVESNGYRAIRKRNADAGLSAASQPGWRRIRWSVSHRSQISPLLHR